MMCKSYFQLRFKSVKSLLMYSQSLKNIVKSTLTQNHIYMHLPYPMLINV